MDSYRRRDRLFALTTGTLLIILASLQSIGHANSSPMRQENLLEVVNESKNDTSRSSHLESDLDPFGELETRSLSSEEFMENYGHYVVKKPSFYDSIWDALGTAFSDIGRDMRKFFQGVDRRDDLYDDEEDDKDEKIKRAWLLQHDSSTQKYGILKDPVVAAPLKRQKRFVLYGSRWPRVRLTYKLRNPPSSMANQTDVVQEIVDRAFKAWSNVTVLNFEKRENKANILIKFVKGKHLHCTRGQFTAKLTAHAFLPGSDMNATIDIHFDDNHNWTAENLYPTVLHEIGHTLGLDDSYKKSSVMHSEENTLSELQQDDIVGIQALYSSRKMRSLSKFHVLRAKSLPNSDLEEYVRNMKSLDDCASYAEKHKINLTVWDKDAKKCAVQYTDAQDWHTFYSELGKPMGHYDVFGSDRDTTESQADLINWINNKQCDMILKLDSWPLPNRTSYKCKLYKDNKSSLMLFRIDGSTKIAHALTN